MQNKSFHFDKKVSVGKTLNLGICSKFGRNFEGHFGKSWGNTAYWMENPWRLEGDILVTMFVIGIAIQAKLMKFVIHITPPSLTAFALAERTTPNRNMHNKVVAPPFSDCILGVSLC